MNFNKENKKPLKKAAFLVQVCYRGMENQKDEPSISFLVSSVASFAAPAVNL